MLSTEEGDRLRAFERRGHDALADSYHDFFSPITALAIEPLLDAVALQPGLRLLDLACGPGALAAAAAARGAHAVGVDLAPRMVALARRLHPGVAFQEGEIEHMPFAPASIDAVVCAFGLGHLPHPERGLAECVRVLAPGRWLAFSWWDDPSRQRMQGVFREALAEVGAKPPAEIPSRHNMMRFSDSAAFAALLRDAGLADVAIAEHASTYAVPDAETLWQGGLGSFALTGAAVRAQDAATQQAIRAAFERRLAPLWRDGHLAMPIAFKIGSGRKP